MEIENLVVLGYDEVGLVMNLVLDDYGNAISPEKYQEILNQGEAVYNADWGHDRNFWQHLMGARNHNSCV